MKYIQTSDTSHLSESVVVNIPKNMAIGFVVGIPIITIAAILMAGFGV